ncbi:MAG TPA: hypothetical protein VG389_10735 [Myxococcota bacterium]|jgi:hypothetical protein|nr:hypothetical protein [Myxococcota bacterium]
MTAMTDTIPDFPTFKGPGDTLILLTADGALRERRRRRSTRTEEALNLCLRDGARRLGLKALVLADDLGLPLASAPSEVDARTLAAWCPLAVGPARQKIGQGSVARGLTAALRPHGGGKVRMRRFNGGVGALYLCAVGRTPRGALDDVQRTIERIFSTTD